MKAIRGALFCGAACYAVQGGCKMFVDEILKSKHSNESDWTVNSFGFACFSAIILKKFWGGKMSVFSTGTLGRVTSLTVQNRFQSSFSEKPIVKHHEAQMLKNAIKTSKLGAVFFA